MKKLLLSIAIVSMMLLSLDAPTGILNGLRLNGLYLNGTLNGLRLNGVDLTVNLHSLGPGTSGQGRLSNP